MNAMKNMLVAAMLATGLFGATANLAFAEPAGFVYYGSFPESATAARQVQLLNDGNDGRYDAGWAESSADPVTRQFRVYARPKVPGTNTTTNPGGGVLLTKTENLTKAHPEDRFRLGCHAIVYSFNMTAGQRYTLDLTSPAGPNFFDTWLRIQDTQGNALADDDDSGEGLNARIIFTAPRTGVYHIVVTSYGRGATGNFTLTVR